MENREFEVRICSLEKNQDKQERRLENLEKVVNEVDKTLQVSLEQLKNIAEDLKQTSINFKEAMMRSNMANSKETELLKEKCIDLEKKYEKLYNKIEQETVVRDAEAWRNSKKQITAWIIAGVLALLAGALGLSHFFG